MGGSPVSFDAAAAGSPVGAGGRPNLQHAYLMVHEPSTNGSLSAPGALLFQLDFQFNPKEIALAKQASWKREPAKGNKSAPPPQFTGSQPSKLTLEMFFDASAKHDTSVVKTVEKLFSLTTPTQSSMTSKKASPPWVVFRWGSLTGFLAYVSQVSAKYTMFTADGLPIRAACQVTLEELAGDAPKQNPTSGGLVPHRVHQVVEGDSLPAIAYREYGQPALWRAVADLNRIDDPMRMRPGDRLMLPALEELEAHVRVAAASTPTATRPGTVLDAAR
ncbi:peptidase M23 [Nocardioides sp. C4-1]|uniref:CIS tube protein n=1 Tax=Nocardioides sp. C4-1 TaxID=3151851 RepID=UPI003265F8E3